MTDIPEHARRRARRRRVATEERAGIVTRMMRAAEGQVSEIETRLAGLQQQPGDRERDARTFAVLARTIQSLTAREALQDTDARRRRKKVADDHDDEDRIPASIDRLRRELSERLAKMAAGDSTRIPDATDEQGS